MSTLLAIVGIAGEAVRSLADWFIRLITQSQHYGLLELTVGRTKGTRGATDAALPFRQDFLAEQNKK
ncbi:hypothetical protein [Microbulbifer spongiae]|uniref:Uncharacterized protein n=1 Tax=Microbulbifer spongiae TaxID=2944933 RepID=A0ABY9E8Y1_9GAMM|nr:hypothetical protein [Microbulbifer sp. MI-G]WKD48573.1 hypothetical protein M8T91_11635 [Microbulbifer sp. MI-G]